MAEKSGLPRVGNSVGNDTEKGWRLEPEAVEVQGHKISLASWPSTVGLILPEKTTGGRGRL